MYHIINVSLRDLAFREILSHLNSKHLKKIFGIKSEKLSTKYNGLNRGINF